MPETNDRNKVLDGHELTGDDLREILKRSPLLHSTIIHDVMESELRVIQNSVTECAVAELGNVFEIIVAPNLSDDDFVSLALHTFTRFHICSVSGVVTLPLVDDEQKSVIAHEISAFLEQNTLLKPKLLAAYHTTST